MSNFERRASDGCCLLVALVIGVGLAWAFHSAGASRHTVDFAHFRVQEINPSTRGFLAVVIGDDRGFAIPLTVDQAASLKSGDIIDFTLEFNGWGTCQGTTWLAKR